MANIIEISNLSKKYSVVGKEDLYALNNISLEISENEIIGVVGESGSGKTTLGKIIAKIIEPSKGSIRYSDKLYETSFRKNVQMIFQDPWTSLDPYWKVKDIILEGVRNFKSHIKEREEDILSKWLFACGFKDEDMYKYSHQFSGGQRQRLAIARALAISPDLVVCDEILSALDASVKGKILNLLLTECKNKNKAMIFIAHDIDIVKMIAEKIIVMKRGEIVEVLRGGNFSKGIRHPYTEELFAAVPSIKRKIHFSG